MCFVYSAFLLFESACSRFLIEKLQQCWICSTELKKFIMITGTNHNKCISVHLCFVLWNFWFFCCSVGFTGYFHHKQALAVPMQSFPAEAVQPFRNFWKDKSFFIRCVLQICFVKLYSWIVFILRNKYWISLVLK